jgi:hypothetical protein
MTPLDKTLKRALSIKGRDYVIHLSPESLKITEKGRRLGVELKWQDLISGQSALAVALQASVGKFDTGPKPPTAKREKPKRSHAPLTAAKSSRRKAKRPPKRPR